MYNRIIFYFVIFFVTGLFNLSAQGYSWELMPGKALDIGSNEHGDVFVVGISGDVFKWAPKTKNWVSFAIPNKAKRIDVAQDGTPWIVANNGDIYKYQKSAGNGLLALTANWIKVPGKAIDIAVRNEVFVIGVSKRIFQLNKKNEWQLINSTGNAKNIAIGKSENPIFSNESLEVYNYDNKGEWIKINIQAYDLTRDARFAYYTIDQNGKVNLKLNNREEWNNLQNSFFASCITVTSTRGSLADHTIWIVTSSQDIYRGYFDQSTKTPWTSISKSQDKTTKVFASQPRYTSVGKQGNLSVTLQPFDAQNQGITLDKSPEIEQEGIGEDVYCSQKIVKGNNYVMNHSLLNPLSEVIWPGAIIDGYSIPTGEYNLINKKRNAVIFTTSTPNFQKTSGFLVLNPTRIKVDQELRKFMNQPVHGMPNEGTEFKVHEVHTESQFNLSLGGHVNSPAGQFSNQFDMSHNSTTNKLVIEFSQKYFTLSVDQTAWNEGEGVLHHDVKINYQEEMPLYVSSVTYGRRGYLSIESAQDLSTLKNEFQAKSLYGGGSFSMETKKLLQESELYTFTLGGNGLKASKATNLEKLYAFY